MQFCTVCDDSGGTRSFKDRDLGVDLREVRATLLQPGFVVCYRAAGFVALVRPHALRREHDERECVADVLSGEITTACGVGAGRGEPDALSADRQ